MRRSTTRNMTYSEAEEIAIRLLSYMATEPEHLSRFLALTGTGPDELRARAGSAEFQTAMLDHLLSDEALLLAFCGNENIDPGLIAPARFTLSGETPEGSF